MIAVNGRDTLSQKFLKIARKICIENEVQRKYLERTDRLSLDLVDLLLKITPRFRVSDAARGLPSSVTTRTGVSIPEGDELSCQSKLAQAITAVVRLLIILETSGLEHVYRFPALGDHYDDQSMDSGGAKTASLETVCLCYWPAILAKRKGTDDLMRVMVKARVSLM